MRIVLLGTGVLPIPPERYGAIPRTVWEYSHALRNAGHEVRILNEVRHRRQRDQFVFAAHLGRRLREAPTDIVHANTGVLGVRLSMLGVPFVFTTHNPAWFLADRTRYRWNFWFDRWATRRAATTIALTDRVREEIDRYIGRSRRGPTVTIPIGVDVEKFHPPDSPEVGVSAVGVGAIRPIKRWELAVRALNGTGIPLRLVGPQPDRGYAERVRASGPVELLGELTDEQLIREVQQARFVIHPSASELLPAVVLQAMACGRPVVGSDAIRPVVTPEISAFVAPPDGGQEEELVGFLRRSAVRLQEDPSLCVAVGRAAREEAVRRHSWEAVVRAHETVYQRVLERHGPAVPGR